MPEEMHGASGPASTERPMRMASPSVEDRLNTAVATAAAATMPVLTPEAHKQLVRAMEQESLHRGRMAKKAGVQLAGTMWSNVVTGLHQRLLNLGPVDNLDAYLNRSVTNQLSKLRTTVEVLVGDETLDVLREQNGDPNLGQVLELNHELIDIVKGIRVAGILTPREMDVYVLCQILGEDNETVGLWLEPPTNKNSVASLKCKAMKKVKKAWRAGKLEHLGYPPPLKRRRTPPRN
ncbi:hypothetical protein [Streptomyces yerevanensis]|uniref:hypothetical protein n=1 Tax=Streptomyces yerevanensis TaxID=66378 RepID=UPI000526D69F|nr:hypothetical protein [Streptomyces yerevanensis]